MEICRTILDNFRNDRCLDSFFQDFKMYVFNTADNKITTLSDCNMLHCLAENDYLLMPGEDEKWLTLPYPKKALVSAFLPICSPPAKRHIFSRQSFTVEFSEHSLSILHSGQKVYEEPIFLMLEYSDESEEIDHPLFEDRLEYLRTMLNDVYGKKAGLRSSYPTISVTKDLSVYFAEQITPILEQGSYSLLTSLKVMLAVTATAEEQSIFIATVSRNQVDIDEVIDVLFKEYIKYCSISLGYRTAVWDSMVAVYSYFKPQLPHETIMTMLDERFKTDVNQQCMSYDIAIMAPFESLCYQLQLFLEADEGCKQELALGLMCSAITYDDL